MTCEIFHINEEDLECRRLIMHSIECALKRGDEVFERFTAKENNIPRISTFKEFTHSLKDINHENLKK